MTPTLDTIVDVLAKNRQRATYGAVAELTGTSPRTLMTGRPRDHRNSWIVAEKDGKPSKYTPEEMDPTLIVRMRIINTKADLAEWLQARSVAASV